MCTSAIVTIDRADKSGPMFKHYSSAQALAGVPEENPFDELEDPPEVEDMEEDEALEEEENPTVSIEIEVSKYLQSFKIFN